MTREIARALGVIITVWGVLGSAPAGAWSWTGDEEGQRLAREARHWLSTQNICGIQLKQSYIDDLDRRIDAHFTSLALDYRRFLLASVMSANADYISKAKTEEIAANCAARINEARQAGVFIDDRAAGTRWVSSPTTAKATTSPSMQDLYGVWGAQTDKCRSARAGTEGPYFELRANRFVPEGGGLCRNVKISLENGILRVTASCAIEEAPAQKLAEKWTIRGDVLISEGSKQTYIRCSK